MDYWILKCALDQYQTLALENFERDKLLYESLYQPEPLSEIWQAPAAIMTNDRVNPDDETHLLPADSNAPGLHSAIAIDQASVNVLMPLISKDVELLPVHTSFQTFYLVHVLTTLTCLDHNLSHIRYFKSGGIKSIQKYVFQMGCLDASHIFRLAETRYTQVYVSDQFKSLVEANALKGFVFYRLPA